MRLAAGRRRAGIAAWSAPPDSHLPALEHAGVAWLQVGDPLGPVAGGRLVEVTDAAEAPVVVATAKDGVRVVAGRIVDTDARGGQQALQSVRAEQLDLQVAGIGVVGGETHLDELDRLDVAVADGERVGDRLRFAVVRDREVRVAYFGLAGLLLRAAADRGPGRRRGDGRLDIDRA